MYIYMHTTLWDIIIYLGHELSPLLIIWCSDQYTYMSCVYVCVYVCVCVCVWVWKPTTNKLFTDRVPGISSIEFRKINPVL